MNLIKGVKDVVSDKDIQIDSGFYEQIETWKAVYKGFHKEWHELTYTTLDGQKSRKMATLNMPKVIASEMATLVFNEKCDVSISDEAYNTEIQNVLSTNNFNNEFQRYLEYSFALGGMVAKPYFDNGLKISFTTADSFVPVSWSADDIREGIFVNEILKGEFKYTHLEWHLWEGAKYLIKNELYRADKGKHDDLGVKVSLATLFPNLQEELYMDNITVPLFVYFKPNTANNIDLKSPLGIPLYANAMDMIRALDTAFDSFEREFKLGKKKIIVPVSAIKSVVDPTDGSMKRYYDPTDEVYEAMNLGMDSDEIKDISMELRVEEHIGAMNAMLGHLAMQIGFSAGAFTFDASGLKTATEVVSENSKTFRTKQSHEILVEAGLKQLIEAIGQVAELYNVFTKPASYDVAISFDDSIAEDMTAITSRMVMLVGAGLESKKRAIMRIHKVTEEEALEILKEIQEDNKAMQAEEVDQFGM